MQGWICIHRELKEHWLWDDKPFSKGQAWIDILLRANHQQGKVLVGNTLYELEKGEFITSKKKLYEAWEWSNRKLDKFLELLSKQEMISYKKHSNKIVIKVLNYAKYQGFEKDKSTQNAQSKHTDCTPNAQRMHSDVTQTTMLNNDNNINNENKRDKEKQTDFKLNGFHAPSLDEVQKYITANFLKCDAQDFFDYYTGNGWMVGQTPMRDWRAMCRKWSRTEKRTLQKSSSITSKPTYNLEKIKADAMANTTIKFD